MLDAEREQVLALRSRGRIPHEVVEDLLRMLDVEETVLDARVRQRRALTLSLETGHRPGGGRLAPSRRAVDACEHLASAGPLTTMPADQRPQECPDCLAEGTGGSTCASAPAAATWAAATPRRGATPSGTTPRGATP